MPTAGSCQVCVHPERVAIEAALRAGVPGVRATARQFQLADHNVLLRHSKKHMQLVAPKPAEVVRAKIAAAAPVQIERASVTLARATAERAVDRAAAAQELAETLVTRAMGTEAEPGDVEVAVKALKALVDANGGGLRQTAETLGKITGEIKSGSQTLVLIQDGRVVHPELALVMEQVMGALAPWPEAGAAVVRALEAMGA